MSRRTLAGILAVPLLLALWATAMFVPLPYVTYSPGITVNVLGRSGGGEIVQVSGHEAYQQDPGELRMTTVYVTSPGGRVNLLEAMGAWFDEEQALYPEDAVYGPKQTPEETERISSVQMVSSQDTAIAVALKELGYEVDQVVEVLNVSKQMPAHGKLKVRDVLLRIGGTEIETPQDVVDAVASAEAGEPLEFVIRREGERRTVTIRPKDVPDRDVPMIGIVPGPGFTFPFDVDVNIDESIGGPSAGLMFSLAIYDTLTDGSLTGGGSVAGTGTIDAEGNVGPIGGIQQKIAAAENDGAQLFLVPAGNCEEAREAPVEDIRLVRVETMSDALQAIRTWVEDPDAPLPGCGGD